MQAINEFRQARKKLCQRLGLTMKQIRKRHILKNFFFRDGEYSLDVDNPSLRGGSAADIFNKLHQEPS